MDQTEAILIAVLCAFALVFVVLVLSFYTPICDSEFTCFRRKRSWRKLFEICLKCRFGKRRSKYRGTDVSGSESSDGEDTEIALSISSNSSSSSVSRAKHVGEERKPPPRPPPPMSSPLPSPLPPPPPLVRQASPASVRVGLSDPSLVSTLTSEVRPVQPLLISSVTAESSRSAIAANPSSNRPDIVDVPSEDPLIRGELSDEGRDHGLGRIRFNLAYDWTARQLSVKICEARGLPAMDFPMGTSDPYCKVSILPDKSNRVKTQVRPRKLNPTWNEVFLFENFPPERLLDRTLLIQVLDYDRFSRDDAIGDAQFPLVFLHSEDHTRKCLTLWRNLQPNRKTRGFVGEVLLSLCYNPHTNQLNLVLMRAKDLKAMDMGRTSDPYCVAKLVHSKTRRVYQRHQTTVIRRCLCPQWNESFSFNVPADKVHEFHLELVVKDKDILGSDTIGRIRLGTRSCPSETSHWTEVLSKPRQQVARWHTLKH